MFNPRELDWYSYMYPQNITSGDVFLDRRNDERRILVQSPTPMQYSVSPSQSHFIDPMDQDLSHIQPMDQDLSHIQPMDQDLSHIQPMDIPDDESEGYSTPDEEIDNVYDDSMVGVERREGTTSPERRLFSTPCGQTYWVDEDNCLYTNKTVEIPIGYWCERYQCVYLGDGSDYETDDDDEYDVPPTPPPVYEESNSSHGSPVPMDTQFDSEVDGETIVLSVVSH
jgi:hypothetical protein